MTPQPTVRNADPSQGTLELREWCEAQGPGVKGRLALSLRVARSTISHILAGRVPTPPQRMDLIMATGISYRRWDEAPQ